MSKELHKGHRQRVKNRFVQYGLASFEDHQALELLLFYCYPMVDTNEKAHKMLQEFGTLSNLFDAHPNQIAQRCGVTENVAILVSLIPSLAKRYNEGRWRKKVLLDSSSKVGNYAKSLFVDKIYECFYLICLDSQKRLLFSPLVSEGTIDEAAIYPRLVVECCIQYQAASVILTHNHPSGHLEASPSDLDATKKIKDALETINVEVLDHVIVAGDGYLSFAEKGILRLLK